MLPLDVRWPPTSAIIMLAGIYYGAQFGGSTTSILVNIPGEGHVCCHCLDGMRWQREEGRDLHGYCRLSVPCIAGTLGS